MGRSLEVDVTTTATEGDHFTGSTVVGEFAADVTAVKVIGYLVDDPSAAALVATEIVAAFEAGPSEGTTTVTVSGAGPLGVATVSIGVGQGAPGRAWDEQPETIAGVDPAGAAIPPSGAVEADPAPTPPKRAPKAPEAT